MNTFTLLLFKADICIFYSTMFLKGTKSKRWTGLVLTLDQFSFALNGVLSKIRIPRKTIYHYQLYFFTFEAQLKLNVLLK